MPRKRRGRTAVVRGGLRCLALLAGSVQYGIQRGIVIHFELPIKFKPNLTFVHIEPKLGQAGGQIAALFLKQHEASAVASTVCLVDLGTLDLLGRVEDL